MVHDNGFWDLPKADPNVEVIPYRDTLSESDKIKWDEAMWRLEQYYEDG